MIVTLFLCRAESEGTECTNQSQKLTYPSPNVMHHHEFSRVVLVFRLNSLRPRQNRRHFADDVFKCNYLNENVWIPIEILLEFVPKGSFNNIPALVQIVAWRRTGDKPLSEPMMTQFNDAYMRHSASMSLDNNDVNKCQCQTLTKFNLVYHRVVYIVIILQYEFPE